MVLIPINHKINKYLHFGRAIHIINNVIIIPPIKKIIKTKKQIIIHIIIKDIAKEVDIMIMEHLNNRRDAAHKINYNVIYIVLMMGSKEE